MWYVTLLLLVAVPPTHPPTSVTTLHATWNPPAPPRPAPGPQLQYGKTPLYIACAKGNDAIVALLIKHAQQQRTLFASSSSGAPRTAPAAASMIDQNGQTALWVACQLNQVSVVRLLLKHNEYVEMTNIPNIVSCSAYMKYTLSACLL